MNIKKNRIILFAFSASSMAFASKSIHIVWLEYLVLAIAFSFLIISLYLCIKNFKNKSI